MPTLPLYEKEAKYSHFRCHQDPKNVTYIEFIKNITDDFLVTYETHSNRPHFHCVYRIIDPKYRSLKVKQLLKERFSFHGNTDFMVKNISPTSEDLQTAIEYLCKSDDKNTPPVILGRSPNYTDEHIAKYHNDYWTKKITTYFPEVVDLNAVVANEIVTKQRKETWSEKVTEKIQSDYMHIDWDWRDESHRELMYEIVMRRLGEKSKIFNEHKIKEFIYAQFNALNARNFRDDIKAKVLQLL